MARNSKLTPIVQEAIVKVLRTGATHKMAAAYVEVDISTFVRWMSRSASFRAAVRKAEADNDIALVGRIRASAQSGDWKAAAHLLERQPRTRAEWGPKLELVGDPALPIEVKHTHGLALGTSEQLAQLAQLATALDVMVRVGSLPQLGAGTPSPRRVGPADAASDDEVHPA